MTSIPQKSIKVNKKVLIITDEWLAPSLALELQNEGNEVFLASKRHTNVLKGTIKRINYSERVDFAKDMDLVIYEDKSNRDESRSLRTSGLSVIGGSKLVDKLELDRMWANGLAEKAGILATEMHPMESFEDIYNFIKERGGKWVLKQCGKIDEIKGLNFVSKMDNSEDLLDYLPIMQKNWVDGVKPDFVLQEKVEGHEVGIGSYWNGHEFMKDKDGDEICEINWEHKPLFPGNLGESTGEQYTVMKYEKAKYSKLFSETLDKCRPLLKAIDFRGDFDINTIVNEKGAYFLEFTPRLGVPATSAQLEIHNSSWFDFLKAMADGGQDPNFDYSEEFCIVSWMYTKPFPFVNSERMSALYDDSYHPEGMEQIAETISFRMGNSEGIIVNFKPDFTKDDWSHIHPDGLRFQDKKLKIANPDGYILTATSLDSTVELAGEKLDELLKKIVVPKSFWRNDFSSSNYHKSKEDLEKWGYILDDDGKKKKIEDSKEKELKTNKRLKIRSILKKMVL